MTNTIKNIISKHPYMRTFWDFRKDEWNSPKIRKFLGLKENHPFYSIQSCILKAKEREKLFEAIDKL